MVNDDTKPESDRAAAEPRPGERVLSLLRTSYSVAKSGNIL
jgi:hypothetical protein